MSPSALGVAVSVFALASVWRTGRKVTADAIVRGRFRSWDSEGVEQRPFSVLLLRSLPPQLDQPLTVFAAACLASAGLLVAGTIEFPVALTLVGLQFLLVRQWRSAIQRRSARDYLEALPLAIEAVAQSLRSGAGLAQAITEAGERVGAEVGADLRHIVETANHGIPLLAALEDWNERRQLPDVAICAASLSLVAEVGSRAGRVLDDMAQSLRISARAMAMAQAQAASAIASAWLLTALPVVIMAPVVLFDEDTRHFLFRSGLGQSMLVTGVLLDAAGAEWMSRAIRRGTRP